MNCDYSRVPWDDLSATLPSSVPEIEHYSFSGSGLMFTRYNSLHEPARIIGDSPSG
jgi:hypothetical protein